MNKLEINERIYDNYKQELYRFLHPQMMSCDAAHCQTIQEICDKITISQLLVLIHRFKDLDPCGDRAPNLRCIEHDSGIIFFTQYEMVIALCPDGSTHS